VGRLGPSNGIKGGAPQDLGRIARRSASSPAVIDVTRRPAEELDFVKSGKTKVNLEVVK